MKRKLLLIPTYCLLAHSGEDSLILTHSTVICFRVQCGHVSFYLNQLTTEVGTRRHSSCLPWMAQVFNVAPELSLLNVRISV